MMLDKELQIKLLLADRPWEQEPQQAEEWVDADTGYECSIWRNPNMGHLCGYITVGADHPWYSLGYDEVDVDVHGGLTYSDKGEFGFDCAHAGDLVPKMYALKGGHYSGETYKGMGYVVGELIKLAKQAKEAVK
jgi:hypothetical protein